MNINNFKQTVLSFSIFWIIVLFCSCDYMSQGESVIDVLAKERLELRMDNQLFVSRTVKYYVSLAKVPQYLIDFLIFQEDQNFFSHNGYSLRDIFIVFRDYIWKGHRLRGTSTLTQQLARALFLNQEKSIWRKITELRIAFILERNLTKEQILELYLNHVYWGHGVFGLAEASQLYFSKQVKYLKPRETSFLVSILPKPSACRFLRICKDEGVLRRMKRLESMFF